MTRKKILQVTSCFKYGGTEAYIMNNYREIDRNNYNFDFWIFKEEESPYEEEINRLGGKIYHGELPEFNRIVPFIRSLVLHIKSNGPYEAIHSHINIMNGWVMLAAFIGGISIRISHSHSNSGKYTDNIIKKLYYKILEYMIKVFSNKKLACSLEAGNYLYGEKYFRLYGEVVKNGIELNEYINNYSDNISKLRNEYLIPENHIVVGNITRFDENKNQEYIIKIFKELKKIEPNITLILGGSDGGQLAYVKEKSRKLNLDKSIRFIGTRNDVNDWLHIMDAYLFPSFHEGLGIAILEAQASGLKCFVSTGIPKEVDLGIGLVDFLDLGKNPKYWAKHILNNLINNDVHSELISTTFDANGYSIASSILRIQEIYKGE